MKQNYKDIMIIYIILTGAFLGGCETSLADQNELVFSKEGGLYEDEFLLELTTNIQDGTIYYTLDGSEPTPEAIKYTDEIIISDRTDEENIWSAIVVDNSSGGGRMDFGAEGFPGFGENNGGRPALDEDGLPDFDEDNGRQSTFDEDRLPDFGEDNGGQSTFDEDRLPDFGENNGRRPAFDDEQAPDFNREAPQFNEALTPESGGSPAFNEDGAPPMAPEFDDELPSDPNENRSALNEEGFSGINNTTTVPEENVFKGTVIKAAVFSDTGEQLTDSIVQSYFISEDIFNRYDLPIISIVADGEHLFDVETGIYMNYNESGSDWERPVSFTLYEADGSEGFSLNLGMRISGNTSRGLTQKALRFYARSEYDEHNTIEYELFESLTTSNSDEPLTTFKRFTLRNSGQDNSATLFRDVVQQSLVSDLNVNTQAGRPAIAFVNGEFWGIYMIQERYDDHYFANHYQIDKDDVALLEISQGNQTPEIKEGDESDLEFYQEMVNFFEENSLMNEENYLKAQEYLDIDNIIDYFIVNIYSANADWPANNNLFWRYKTANGGYNSEAEWYEDGRFRWIIKDLDWGFGLRSDSSHNTLAHALNEMDSTITRRGLDGFTSDSSTLFIRKLLENETFKAKFINRFSDVMNTNYDLDTVVNTIEEMARTIENAIDEQSNRYPSSVSSVESWEEKVATMIEFATERTECVEQFLAERFDLSHLVTVTLNTDSEKGYIRINDMDITLDKQGVTTENTWSGKYFAQTNQTFTAIPLEGYEFVKFRVTDHSTTQVTEYVNDSIEIILGSEGVTVEAVFE